MRVGFGTNKPPYVFEDAKNGLEVDIVMQAANLAGFEATPMFAPMERLHHMLAYGDIDAIATTNPNSGLQAFYSETYITYNNVAAALSARKFSIVGSRTGAPALGSGR